MFPYTEGRNCILSLANLYVLIRYRKYFKSCTTNMITLSVSFHTLVVSYKFFFFYGGPLWHDCCVSQQRKQYFSSQKISPSVFNLTTLRFLTSLCPCRDFYGNYFDKNVTDLKLQLFLQNVSPSAPGGKLLAGTRHVHGQCSDKSLFTSFRRFSKVSVKTAEMS